MKTSIHFFISIFCFIVSACGYRTPPQPYTQIYGSLPVLKKPIIHYQEKNLIIRWELPLGIKMAYSSGDHLLEEETLIKLLKNEVIEDNEEENKLDKETNENTTNGKIKKDDKYQGAEINAKDQKEEIYQSKLNHKGKEESKEKNDTIKAGGPMIRKWL